METLKVQQEGKFYLLYNLTNVVICELKNDSEKLKAYFNDCLQTQQNICILEDEKYKSWPSPSETNQMHHSNHPSTSTSLNDLSPFKQNLPITSDLMHDSSDLSTSTSSNASLTVDSRKNSKFVFLCGRFENQILIYAVKFADHQWHYFDALDSISSEHDWLSAEMFNPISRFDKVRNVTVNMNESQSQKYFYNGKFIFKNKELHTFMEIAGKPIGNKTCKSKSSDKTTKRLVFVSGQTNPFLFLKDFENSQDLKSDKDKMYKILHFVDECHKGEFTKLFFNSDWVAVKSSFLKLYTLPFVENKKRELSIDFEESESLRSFFERKLTSLSKFTTLPFINQVEIVMNDLPSEISGHLIVNGMMTCNKTEILDFCETIQDLVEHVCRKPEERPNEGDLESNQPSNKMRMETFNFMPEMSEDEQMQLDSPQSSKARGSGVKDGDGISAEGVASGTVKKRGRPKNNRDSGKMENNKKLKPISEDDESSDTYTYLEEVSNTSHSTWSDM